MTEVPHGIENDLESTLSTNDALIALNNSGFPFDDTKNPNYTQFINVAEQILLSA